MFRLLEERPGSKGAPGAATELEPAELSGATGPRIVCAGCLHVLTRGSERIPVEGEHEHVRVNPFGYAFRFACFARAPGCVLRGEAERTATWFPGRAWRYAHCGGCGGHLGWHWEQLAGEGSFFGLIVPRITELRDAPEA
ncbi:MAG: cereblon family protein [Deltaproteobacteria bacterium]|nr:cereblon family protein [Deltaproteobacteria bacterium]